MSCAVPERLKPIGIPTQIFLKSVLKLAHWLDEDTERVRAEFQNRGYFKVVVQGERPRSGRRHQSCVPLIQSGPGKAVDITMPIEEGDKYN